MFFQCTHPHEIWKHSIKWNYGTDVFLSETSITSNYILLCTCTPLTYSMYAC